jgi:hypothetical protein
LVVAEAVIVGSPRCVNPNCNVRDEWRQDAEAAKQKERRAGQEKLKCQKCRFCCG